MQDPIANFFRPPTKTSSQPIETTHLPIPPLQPIGPRVAQASTVNIKTHRLASMLEKYPFGWITGGRFEPSDIAQVTAKPGPRQWTEEALKQNSIMERNYALAATT